MEFSGVLTGRCVQIGMCVCVLVKCLFLRGMEMLAFPEVTTIGVFWLCKLFLHMIEKDRCH